MDIQIAHYLRRLAVLFSCAILLALISSCGSSSSDNDVFDGDDSVGDSSGIVSGLVVDAVTGAPLTGVTVSLANDSTTTAFSAPNGSWQIGPVSPSDDLFRFALPGFREELLSRPSLGDPIPPIELIPEDNAGNGGLTGNVVNLNGESLGGVVLQFIEGINITDGPVVGTTTSGADGIWTIVELPYGNYTCILIFPGSEPVIQIVQVLGNITQTQPNVTIQTTSVLPPIQPLEALGPDDVRIEMSWNTPTDLRHVLIRSDGSEITRDSAEFTSGDIVLMPASDELPRTSSITLSRSLLEGLLYSVVSDNFLFFDFTTEVSFANPQISVLDQSGTLAEFVPGEDRSFRRNWIVFNFVDGQPVDLAN